MLQVIFCDNRILLMHCLYDLK